MSVLVDRIEEALAATTKRNDKIAEMARLQAEAFSKLGELIDEVSNRMEQPPGLFLSKADVEKVRELLVRIRDRIGTSGIESEWAEEALSLLRSP